MPWFSQFDVQKLLLFTLVLARVSGLMVTAPVYGTREVPIRIRAFLAIALAVLITPTQWGVAVYYPGSIINYLVLVGAELFIGLCLGLGVAIIFSGIQLAGQLIGRTSGLLLADVLDPSTGTDVSVFSRLLLLVTLAVFVCIGGHRVVMAGLLDTFQVIEPGRATVNTSILDTFVVLLTESFALGLRAAMPVVVAVLLSTLVMGLISRTLPQLNILAVGFGANSMLTLGTLSLSLGAAVWVFQDQIEPVVRLLMDGLCVPFRSQWLT